MARFKLTRRKIIAVVLALVALLGFLAFFMREKPDTFMADLVRSAAADGKLAYKLTEPEELKTFLGHPFAEIEKGGHGGGLQALILRYKGIVAVFNRMKGYSVPYTLYAISMGGRRVDIGQKRQIVLRNEGDLKKFDSFWGFGNTSLSKLDLREHQEFLEKMPFDSRTKWPAPDKMPKGFDPIRLLEEGKNPGLGIRSLHKQGIDGSGVSLAIIDQPLLENHQEYTNRLVRYREIGLMARMASPQMHGPPVCSIAVGKSCGVAPKTNLYYFAVPTWQKKWQGNQLWCNLLNKIIKLNKKLKPSEKIRVVSISLGAFSQRQNFDLWEKTVEKATQHGILVVTCDSTFLKLGTLKHIENKSPDDPSNYQRNRYAHSGAALWVPVGNRTIASYHGPGVYTYERTGGISWAAPYLAGLAALAYQIEPKIEPKTIVKLWVETAVQTEAGPVVNPTGFIKAVQNNKK